RQKTIKYSMKRGPDISSKMFRRSLRCYHMMFSSLAILPLIGVRRYTWQFQTFTMTSGICRRRDQRQVLKLFLLSYLPAQSSLHVPASPLALAKLVDSGRHFGLGW